MEDNPMKYYAGLDVSNAETSICIVDQDNNIVKEAKVDSDPDAIHQYFTKKGIQLEKIGIEAGALSYWLVTGLKARGWKNVFCIDSRVMASILAVNINKTDRNDARSIANAMRCNNYKEVHIKSIESIKTNCLLSSRKALVKQKNQLGGTVRGILKTFGIKLPKGKESIRQAIKEALAFDKYSPDDLKLSVNVDWSVIEALVVCYEKIDEQLAILEKKLELLAKEDQVVQRLITHPGVGIVTAMSFKAEIDDPTRFKKSRSVGAYFGMTPKQFSSGETIKQGRVSKNGSNEMRALLHEAGVVLITRTKKNSKLKSWGLKKKRKLKTQKAGMAVGRKIAINLHRMWLEGRDFDPQLDAEEFYPEEKRKARGKRIKKKSLKV
jgi:transposase